jgi:hypothetical protein
MMVMLIMTAHVAYSEEVPDSLLASTTTQEDMTLIDPELSNAPLPQLVLPPEPPPGLRLPDLVIKKDERRGVQCAVKDERHAVFQHADKWTAFWEKALAPFSSRLAKVPSVDFDKDMVVGVFMGERTKPSYEIVIRSVRMEDQKEGGKALVVRYREISKMQAVFIPPFAIQPFDLKRVPRYDGRVVFTQVRR